MIAACVFLIIKIRSYLIEIVVLITSVKPGLTMGADVRTEINQHSGSQLFAVSY